MKEQQLKNKMDQDTQKIKEDINALVGDGAVQMSRIEDNISKATGKANKDVTAWVEDGVSQMSDGFEKITSETRENVADAANMMKKDVGHKLRRYNSRAQDIADKIPYGFARKAARYPWVVISIGLVLGFILGNLLKPSRQPLG